MLNGDVSVEPSCLYKSPSLDHFLEITLPRINFFVSIVGIILKGQFQPC
jgi:hypothetical protein